MRPFWFRDDQGTRIEVTPCGLGAHTWHLMRSNASYLEECLVKLGHEGFFAADNEEERSLGVRFEMGPKEWLRGRRYKQPLLRAFVSPRLSGSNSFWVHFKVRRELPCKNPSSLIKLQITDETGFLMDPDGPVGTGRDISTFHCQCGPADIRRSKHDDIAAEALVGLKLLGL